MSEIASAVERTRKAFASVSQLEEAVARDPQDRSLQLNLTAMRKMAAQSEEQLLKFSECRHIEVCNYRLIPEATDSYALPHVSQSWLEYQNLFSQIYDAKRNGKTRSKAQINPEAFQESVLEFGYSYSGSLGVVLFRPGSRDLISGKFDESIDALYQCLDIRDQDDVRTVAQALGNAVVRRIADWSKANLQGGFAADVRWTRSDGRQLGEVIERSRMDDIVGIIAATSDVETTEVSAAGVLIGGDIQSGAFHFVVPGGADYRGRVADEFSADTQMTLGKSYRAVIREMRTTVYATEKVQVTRELLSLEAIDPSNLPRVLGPSASEESPE